MWEGCSAGLPDVAVRKVRARATDWFCKAPQAGGDPRGVRAEGISLVFPLGM